MDEGEGRSRSDGVPSFGEAIERIRWRLEPGAIRAIAVMLVVVVGVVAWLVSRGGPTQTPTPARIAASGSVAPTALAGASGESTPTSSALIVVDVVGPVRHPGIVSLPVGSRVADAIAAAGGLRPGREGVRAGLNLARVLQDGEQVDASAGSPPAAASTSGSGSSTGSNPTAGAGGKLDLNTATLEQLDQLPRIGPVTAEKILDFRQEHGGFRTVDQLLEVPGIGDRTLEQLAPLVRV